MHNPTVRLKDFDTSKQIHPHGDETILENLSLKQENAHLRALLLQRQQQLNDLRGVVHEFLVCSEHSPAQGLGQ